MIGMLGLLLRVSVLGRRALAGIVAYAVIVGILYAAPGPLHELYGPTSAALIAITAWLVVSGLAVDQGGVTMLAAAAGGPVRLHLLRTSCGALMALPLAIGSVIAGRALAPAPPDGRIVIIGLIAHLTAVLVGAGIGTMACRAVVSDAAVSPVIVIGGFVLVVVVPAASPFGPVLDALRDGLAPQAEVGQAAAWGALGVVWALGFVLLGGLAASRRRAYGTVSEP